MPSLLGIETSVDEDSRSSRTRIQGVERTDQLGRVVCQSGLTFHAGDLTLKLSLKLTPETIEPIFSGAAWAGTVLWRAAVRLVDVLLDRHIEGARVVELGCGLGVPGMVCKQLGADLVVLTEQENLVDLATRNLTSNFSDDQKILARELDWTDQKQLTSISQFTFDLILCCDCVYIPLYGDSWRALVTAINALAGPHTAVLISVERRIVGGGTDGVDLFLDAMATAGFIIVTSFPTDPPVEIFEFRRR